MIRYLFHGGTREINSDGSKRSVGIAHNSAFMFAARNVAADYKSGETRLLKITTAVDLVSRLNKNDANSIASLDIFCHGTPYSLNFSVKENENCGLVTGWMTKQLLSAYYSSWEDGIYTFSNQSRKVSNINFNIFKSDARIQIHGCNTARGSMLGNTLVEEFAEQLYAAGKLKSYVIGHTDKSNPNIKGHKTTITQQDYRHGERAIYNGDKLIKKTSKAGLIEHQYIQSIIEEKSK